MRTEMTVYQLGELQLDFPRRKLTNRRKTTNMTPHMFKLLLCLVEQYLCSPTREDLYALLYPNVEVESQEFRLRTLCSRLYNRLRSIGLDPRQYFDATDGVVRLQKAPRPIISTPSSGTLDATVTSKGLVFGLGQLQRLSRTFYCGERLIRIADVELHYVELWSNTTHISREQVHYVHLTHPYRLQDCFARERDERLAWFRAMTGNKEIFDTRKVRLYDLKATRSRLTVTVQDTSYFDSVASNFSLDYPTIGRSVRAELARRGRLPALSEMLCSDHIGVNINVLTKDLELVLARRSYSVAVNQGTIDSLCSGSADALAARFDLYDEAWRELESETAIRPSELRPPGLILLGCARNLYYGGKPIFFFLAIAELSFDRLRAIFVERRPEEMNETAVDGSGRPMYVRLSLSQPMPAITKRLTQLVKKKNLGIDLRAAIWFLWEFLRTGRLRHLLR